MADRDSSLLRPIIDFLLRKFSIQNKSLSLNEYARKILEENDNYAVDVILLIAYSYIDRITAHANFRRTN